MKTTLIVFQIFVAMFDIILAWTENPSFIANYLKAGICLLNGNISYAGFMLTDGIREVASLAKESLKTPIVPAIILVMVYIGATTDFSLSGIVISAGIFSSVFDIWIENEKGRVNHFYWMIADIMAGYYILAVGEAAYVLKSFVEIVVQEWKACGEEIKKENEEQLTREK